MAVMGMGLPTQAVSAAPFQSLTPEMLAQLAAAGFRPPGLGSAGGGGGMMPMQPQGDNGLSAGMAGLGLGLGAYGRSVQPGSDMLTQAPGFGAGLDSAGQNVLADAHKQWAAQNANDPSIAGYMTPPTAGSGGGLFERAARKLGLF